MSYTSYAVQVFTGTSAIGSTNTVSACTASTFSASAAGLDLVYVTKTYGASATAATTCVTITGTSNGGRITQIIESTLATYYDSFTSGLTTTSIVQYAHLTMYSDSACSTYFNSFVNVYSFKSGACIPVASTVGATVGTWTVKLYPLSTWATTTAITADTTYGGGFDNLIVPGNTVNTVSSGFYAQLNCPGVGSSTGGAPITVNLISFTQTAFTTTATTAKAFYGSACNPAGAINSANDWKSVQVVSSFAINPNTCNYKKNFNTPGTTALAAITTAAVTAGFFWGFSTLFATSGQDYFVGACASAASTVTMPSQSLTSSSSSSSTVSVTTTVTKSSAKKTLIGAISTVGMCLAAAAAAL